MKGLFIPEITAEMFRNGCLESIETLMAEGEIYDIDYQQPCEDAISKQAVEEIINDIRDCISVEGYWAILERMKKLPSFNPQPKTGEWVTTNDYVTTAYGTLDYYRCSCCGEDSLEDGDFCPNCGAKMESEDEEGDRQ